MRILRVAQKIYPDSKGGGAYHIHALSRDQAEMGHDVTVLSVGDGPSKEHQDGYSIVRKPSLIEPLGNEIAPGVVNFLRRADSFDVIHAHSHLYFSTNLSALARKLGQTPFAITNHGLYSQTAPPEIFDVYLRTLGRWTFNQADVVFTYTDEERDELRELGVKTDVEVVANGIDTNRFTPAGPSDDRLVSPSILFVGRLVDGKRPVDTVHALSGVQDRGIDATLYVAGTGPLESELRSTASESGLEESIVFLGHLPYEDMPAVYRAADVLVLPSRDEGMPRTVLEAIASGTPVVASALPQLTDVVGGKDRTVEIGDTEQMAEAIYETLATSESLSNTEPQLDGFEWNQTVKRTTDTLKSLVNHGSPEP